MTGITLLQIYKQLNSGGRRKKEKKERNLSRKETGRRRIGKLNLINDNKTWRSD